MAACFVLAGVRARGWSVADGLLAGPSEPARGLVLGGAIALPLADVLPAKLAHRLQGPGRAPVGVRGRHPMLLCAALLILDATLQPALLNEHDSTLLEPPQDRRPATSTDPA